MKKFSNEEIRLAEADASGYYDVFMAIPKTAGIDKRGGPRYARTPEGYEILGDDLLPIVDDEVALVADDFSNWIAEGNHATD